MSSDSTLTINRVPISLFLTHIINGVECKTTKGCPSKGSKEFWIVLQKVFQLIGLCGRQWTRDGLLFDIIIIVRQLSMSVI